MDLKVTKTKASLIDFIKGYRSCKPTNLCTIGMLECKDASVSKRNRFVGTSKRFVRWSKSIKKNIK